MSQNCANFNSVQEIEKFFACTVRYTGLVNSNVLPAFLKEPMKLPWQPKLGKNKPECSTAQFGSEAFPHMVLKIVFHVVDICMDEFFSFTHCTSTRGHRYQLYKLHFSTTTRAQFFIKRVINVWNALPADVIDFGSVKQFPCFHLKVDLSTFTRCS